MYKRYSRGSIIKVKFGVNIGSEFSGEHYAIVISKGDTMYNPVIHVVPLTSDNSKYNLDVGNILYSKDKLLELKEQYKIKKDLQDRRKIRKCIAYYEKNQSWHSYACIKHVKTISKLSIMKPINEYDFLSKIKASTVLLKLIDREIIKEYTCSGNTVS